MRVYFDRANRRIRVTTGHRTGTHRREEAPPWSGPPWSGPRWSGPRWSGVLRMQEGGSIALPSPEPYSLLRERVGAAGNGHPLRTLMFTDCDGASDTAGVCREFGQVLAAAGFRVLVVSPADDGNESATPLADLLRADDPPLPHVGGSGFLTQLHCDATDVDRETLLRSPEMGAWLERQRGRYDYLLLVARPITRHADASLIAPMMDGVLIVVDAGRTRSAALVQAREQLERCRAHVVGVVLNGMREVPPTWLG